jgi:hypothetical protein
VIADPEPQEPAVHSDAERAMMKAYSARTKAAYALQIKRGVVRVSFEKLIFLIGQALTAGRRPL